MSTGFQDLGLVHFLGDPTIRSALWIGTMAAMLNGVIGVFAILRGQAFAGHALGDISSAGGAAAVFTGISALWGFLGMAWLAALILSGLGLKRAGERDLVTGVVLGGGLGISALFLYLDATGSSHSGATVSIMFGSLFGIPGSMVLPVILSTLSGLLLVLLCYHPLLLIAADPDLARARGVPAGLLETLYLLLLGLAAAISALTVGAILATALLLGPAGAALHLAGRPAQAFLYAAGIALFCTVTGIYLSYESFYWFGGTAWPVSFFVVVLVLLSYLLAAAWSRTGTVPGRPALHGAKR